MLPTLSNPDAATPTEWLAFLDALWPDDPQSIALIQEWMGYLLTADTSQQKIALLIGPPRSGKGTIARVITAMLGKSNVCNPTLSQFSLNFGLAPLIGKLAAIITDARISARTDTAVIVERLLSISGEDDQTIDRKHRSEVTGKLSTRFMVISNELPNIRDTSGAMASRFLVMQLTHSFLGREDTTLSDRLMEELPGILRWSIDGWARLRERRRFTQPDASRDLAQAMADVASPIGAFIRGRCEVGPGESVLVSELYLAWKTWCLGKGREHPGDEEEFGRRIRAVVPGLKRSRPRIDKIRTPSYVGIRLLTPGELMAIDEEDGSAQEFDLTCDA